MGGWLAHGPLVGSVCVQVERCHHSNVFMDTNISIQVVFVRAPNYLTNGRSIYCIVFDARGRGRARDRVNELPAFDARTSVNSCACVDNCCVASIQKGKTRKCHKMN